MKLAIMQPYFMPYIGYFSLIKNTDELILFDSVQFIRHGWIERNRILRQSGGWQYIQVPIIKENGRDTRIKDIKINNTENWKDKMRAQLQHYKKIAPYFKITMSLLDEVFAPEYEDIVSLNRYALQIVCEYLGINRKFPIFSQMGLEIKEVTASDEWALNICKALGANEYLNPIGGTEFFDRSKYESAGVSISFQHVKLEPYNQKRDVFEPGLSILDVMMFNSPDEINRMLSNYTLE